MIWIALFPICYLILQFRNRFTGYTFWSYVRYNITDLMFPLLVVSIFGSIFAYLLGLFIPQDWAEPEISQLISLRSNEGVQANLFLGTGTIGNTQYYFFYKEAGQGYTPVRVVADENVTIFEEDRRDGIVKTFTSQFKNPLFKLIAFKLVYKQKFEFIIPGGSLKRGYDLE